MDVLWSVENRIEISFFLKTIKLALFKSSHGNDMVTSELVTDDICNYMYKIVHVANE